MKARLLRSADQLRQSYWFLPTIMTVAAVFLAGGMIWLDSYVGSEWMDGFAWLYASRPSGARQVLSAIGGSMITVAGTVFSVTTASVVYASGQYGPRLLSNFMRDRGNQVTLGTFISTFIYCLIVLRTVRSPEESYGAGFVPNLALLVAVLLAICSIAVLIFFIHHVPSKLHINSVIQDVGDRLLHEVKHRFPASIGTQCGDEDAKETIPAIFRRGADIARPEDRARVCADDTGYIQLVDDETLMRIATDEGVVCRLQHQPGDFVHAGRTLVEICPASRASDEALQSLREAFVIGSQRTALQDLRFLIDELVEIGARALSPGVNDPFTAVTCLDWLGATMSDLCVRDIPSHLRRDERGAVRVIAYPLTFIYFLDRSFGALLQYCASDMIAALRYLDTLGEVAVGCDDRERVAALGRHADRLNTLAAKKLDGSNYRQVSERATELCRILAEPGHQQRLRDRETWPNDIG